jgi:uncharacterized LabA/DUF88 family protein
MEKTAIFIDGGYFSKILKQYFGMPRIDFKKLSDEICSELQLSRLRTYYYDCMPVKREGNDRDKRLYANKQKFMDKIAKLPRFEIKKGRLQVIGTDEFDQKMVDVLMSLDIVDKCCDHQIQHAILIAGDSDFIPAIKKAKDFGAIIHLYYHTSNVKTELLNEIDESHPISQGFIDKIEL